MEDADHDTRLIFPDHNTTLAVRWLRNPINSNFEYLKKRPTQPLTAWSDVEVLFGEVTTIKQHDLLREAFVLFDENIEHKEHAIPSRNKTLCATLNKIIFSKVIEFMTKFEVAWVEAVGPWLRGFLEVYIKILLSRYHTFVGLSKRSRTRKPAASTASGLKPRIQERHLVELGPEIEEGEDMAPKIKQELVELGFAEGGDEHVASQELADATDDDSLEVLHSEDDVLALEDFDMQQSRRSSDSIQAAASNTSTLTASKLADLDTMVLDQKILLAELKLEQIKQRQVLEEIKLSKLEMERAKVREEYKKRLSLGGSTPLEKRQRRA